MQAGMKTNILGSVEEQTFYERRLLSEKGGLTVLFALDVAASRDAQQTVPYESCLERRRATRKEGGEARKGDRGYLWVMG